MKYLIIILFQLLAFASVAQPPKVQMPIDVPLSLSGTFGEPRGTHFHSGIDIRTDGKTGYKVYSINDGYISRIKVSSTGYGNALYINHPDGTTSVYGHLERFNPKLDSFTMAIHYSKQSFEIDEYYGPTVLPVSKGDVIAFSGNSGGSGGPHLHFEIRDTETQEPMNPHNFGYKVIDNTPPLLSNLHIYTKSTSISPLTTLALSPKSKGIYVLKQDTLSITDKTIGIGINAIDKMESSTGTNGVYSLKLRVNGHAVYSFNMDRISFSTTRYVLSHIDYYEKKIKNNTVYRCYKLEGNELIGIYDSIVNDGFIQVPDTGVLKIELLVCDYEGNQSYTSFYIKKGKQALDAPLPDPITEWLYCYKPADINIEDLRLSFPKSCLYTTTAFTYNVLAKSLSPFSNSYEVMEPGIAVNKRFDLSMMAKDALPDSLKSKALVLRIDEDKDIETYTSTWNGRWVSCNPRNFGTFYIGIDTVKPSIKAVNISNGASMMGKSTIEFKITDNLAGIASYRGTIDGNWVLFKYDAKNNKLYYEFDQHCNPGEHKLQLVVIDEVGNRAVYNCSFKN